MASSFSTGVKVGLSTLHAKQLARLDTPVKIQNYIDAMPSNSERNGETCLAVAGAMHLGSSHCIEAALIAACALWMHGEAPLLMDFQAHQDDDHVVALFQRGNCWGAISKSNHIWLRWRDPVYKSLRELAMSYFHEYVTGTKKTMRAYSRPFDLRRYDPAVWIANAGSCWDIAWDLDQSRHYKILSRAQVKALRPRDRFETSAGLITEYAKSGRRRKV